MPSASSKRDAARKKANRDAKYGGGPRKSAAADADKPPDADDTPPSAAADAGNPSDADDTPLSPPPSAAADAGNAQPPPPSPPPSAAADAGNPSDADDTPPPPPPSAAAAADDTPPPSPSAAADNKPLLIQEEGYFTIEGLTVQVQGRHLLTNATVDLYKDKRCALQGPNGSGKSLLLAAIHSTISAYPDVKCCYVSDGVHGSDLSAIDVVMGDDHRQDIIGLEQLIEDSDSVSNTEQLCNQLDRITQEARHRACVILAGFGFNSYKVQEKINNLHESSWRLKIALARALYVKPDVLLLDNPTKDLDFEACQWLEEQLRELKVAQLIVSNSDSFLTNLCNDAIEINMDDKILVEHTSYSHYLHVKGQQKQKKGQLEGASTNTESENKFRFTDIPGGTPAGANAVQCLQVVCGHDKNKPIFKDLNWDIKFGSKLALVGPNGSGKSTLMKGLEKELTHSKGVTHCSGLRVESFDQRSTHMLDQEKTGTEYMRTCRMVTSDISLIASASNFGLSRQVLDQKIKCLSDGERTRLIFSAMAVEKPDLLLLDEATVHLDSEAVVCLAEGLKKWNGTFVIAGHDERLISLVATEIWVCENQIVTKRGTCDIVSYKNEMIKKRAETHCLMRISSATGVLCPLFSIGSYRNVALPCISYNKYLDCEDKCYREPTISIDRFITKRFMTASAPCNSLEEGFLQIPGEIVPGKRYRVSTEVGKKVSNSLLEALWTLDNVFGFCLSEFTRQNIFVTPSGEVKFGGVQLLPRSDVLVGKNLSSAHDILEDLFTSGKDGPPRDIGHLLDMIKNHPEKRELFHKHASAVPLSNQGDFFMRCFGCLHETIEPTVADNILEDLPHAADFEMDVQSNILLKKYFDHNGGQRYTTTPLPLGNTTAEEKRQYKVRRARNFTYYLRNRGSHKMEHFKILCRYLFDMADLAVHVRFPLVNCYLQEKLHDVGQAHDLMLHNLIK